MILLNPDIVTLTIDAASILLTDVSAVAIDRAAASFILDHTDLGPHPAFADAPEQRTSVRIERAVSDSDDPALLQLAPGAQAQLALRAARSRSDAGAITLEATIVIESIRHQFDPGKGAHQSIRAVAISADAADPVTITEEA